MYTYLLIATALFSSAHALLNYVSIYIYSYFNLILNIKTFITRIFRPAPNLPQEVLLPENFVTDIW
jgi:hypothetical protein